MEDFRSEILLQNYFALPATTSPFRNNLFHFEKKDNGTAPGFYLPLCIVQMKLFMLFAVDSSAIGNRRATRHLTINNI